MYDITFYGGKTWDPSCPESNTVSSTSITVWTILLSKQRRWTSDKNVFSLFHMQKLELSKGLLNHMCQNEWALAEDKIWYHDTSTNQLKLKFVFFNSNFFYNLNPFQNIGF